MGDPSQIPPNPWSEQHSPRGYPGAAPAQHPPHVAPTHPPKGRSVGGILSGVFAAVVAFLKYGLALLKFSKFGLTFLSMAVSIWAYALLYGWKFGVGIVALIFAHEMGHF